MMQQLKECYIVMYRSLSGIFVAISPISLMLIDIWFLTLALITIPLGAVIMERQCKKLIE